MLSFMREQEPKNASARPAPGPGSPGGAAGDAPGAQEFLTVAANSQSLRRSTILVVVLVGIGLVSLLLMIRRSAPQAVSAQEKANDQKIESAISRITGSRAEMAGRMDEIVKKFYEFSDVVQVKVGELAKNPFEAEGAAPNQTMVVDNSAGQGDLLRLQRARSLKLVSIMRTPEQGTCCMINDQILQPGDIIEGFKIVEIGNNSVMLAWVSGETAEAGTAQTDEMKTTLKLAE
ncbi:MAG: hypothetical protein M1376_23900 [Planctomycetes bacterium]|nr:hypothetical protein [Planctomycetota bacterium]